MLYRVVKKRPLCYTAYSMSGGKVSILTVRTACLIDETIKDPNARTVTVKNLKKGKTYYFRTCTYTEVKNRVSGEEKTVKGKWSTKKKVKINK